MRLEPLLRAEITLAPPQELGLAHDGRITPGPLGRRRVIPITGGSFRGDRLAGRVLPGGADWQLLRADGVAELDARYTLETADRALIYVRNFGYRHGPPDIVAKLAAGEPVDPSRYYMRTTPRFETSAEKYRWLNRVICVATGARRAAAVELEVFEVR